MNAFVFHPGSPGPWAWSGTLSRFVHTIDDVKGNPVATTHACHDADANAALLAAAPEGYAFAASFLVWLEQLRKIRAPKDLLPGLEAREREARAFLAKARGESA